MSLKVLLHIGWLATACLIQAMSFRASTLPAFHLCLPLLSSLKSLNSSFDLVPSKTRLSEFNFWACYGFRRFYRVRCLGVVRCWTWVGKVGSHGGASVKTQTALFCTLRRYVKMCCTLLHCLCTVQCTAENYWTAKTYDCTRCTLWYNWCENAPEPSQTESRVRDTCVVQRDKSRMWEEYEWVRVGYECE